MSRLGRKVEAEAFLTSTTSTLEATHSQKMVDVLPKRYAPCASSSRSSHVCGAEGTEGVWLVGTSKVTTMVVRESESRADGTGVAE